MPIEEAFNLQNGLAAKVPLTAYHVTPGILTTAIEKAVAHIINLRFLTGSITEGSDGDLEPLEEGQWQMHVNCLIKGLLSLDVTIGGGLK